ncbi:hypothetical protein KGD82_22740 [Nocardiopsis eucommiae]|uniref:Uncharacterized protein n=1 Tax=Nocardiopsis eucommiae TaxID=2831970 RepID=A0A975QIU1_9ACTN|nr:hypothetical protein KGD82_22740 [Nocardiopsis eucommiae]
MADTQEKDAKRGRPAKKGLHGWKAALTVFGCGTFAAFGVFGAIVGVLGLVLGTASSGLATGDNPVPIADQSVKPREEFLDDKFDLCGRTLRTIPDVNLTFEHEIGQYEDTSVSGGSLVDGDLVRSDSCGGQLTPMGSYVVPWEFDFSYRAIIHSPEEDRDDLASRDLVEKRSEIEGSDLRVTDSGPGDLGDESYYYYSSLEEGPESSYVIVVRQRSATYTIRMASTDDVSREAFAGEARKFGPQLRITLVNRIPK